MSFTLPNLFRTNHVAAPVMERREFELPTSPEVKVLPYDTAAGQLAKRALLLSGVDILRNEFGVKDPVEARERVSNLAEQICSVGFDTEFVLDSKYSDIEKSWDNKAITGTDAGLTLRSIQQLANMRDQGYFADRAADVLSDVHANDTRIPLK